MARVARTSRGAETIGMTETGGRTEIVNATASSAAPQGIWHPRLPAEERALRPGTQLSDTECHSRPPGLMRTPVPSSAHFESVARGSKGAHCEAIVLEDFAVGLANLAFRYTRSVNINGFLEPVPVPDIFG